MSVPDLHDAAGRGDVAEMWQLVATGVDADGADERGLTALHVAAFNGHVEATKTLVQLSAGIQAKAARGETPLHGAVTKGRRGGGKGASAAERRHGGEGC